MKVPGIVGAAIAALSFEPLAQAQPAPVRIVAIGDSYSSGEGVPDERRNGNTPARWQHEVCHRSGLAWPRLAADALGARLGRPVDFVSFACSGAKVPDLIDHEQVRGAGASGEGTVDECRQLPGLQGQLCEVELRFRQPAMAGQTVDALVLTIGGNDVGFAPAIMTCALPTDCVDPVFRTPLGDAPQPVFRGFSGDVEAGRRALGDLYRKLAAQIEAVNARYAAAHGRPLIGNVVALEYPSAFRNERGELCGLPDGSDRALRLQSNPDPLDLMTRGEMRWGEEVVVPALNGAFREFATQMVRADAGSASTRVDPQDLAYGAFAQGSGAAFRLHGFCASAQQRWIVKAFDSRAEQGDWDGSVHPNRKGHEALRDVVLSALLKLKPPATPQWRVSATPGATAFIPGRLRLTLQDVDTGAAFLQVATRRAAQSMGRDRLSPPAQYASEQALATPPRYPAVAPGNDWDFGRLAPQLASLVDQPAAATDFSVRSCTQAACSPWSQPMRVLLRDGFAPLPAPVLLSASLDSESRSLRRRLQLAWQPLPAQPNGFVEVADARLRLLGEVAAGGEGAQVTAGPLTDSVRARQCVWAFTTASTRVGPHCGAWSEPVAVAGALARAAGSAEPARPAPRRLNPDDLRAPNR